MYLYACKIFTIFLIDAKNLSQKIDLNRNSIQQFLLDQILDEGKIALQNFIYSKLQRTTLHLGLLEMVSINMV